MTKKITLDLLKKEYEDKLRLEIDTQLQDIEEYVKDGIAQITRELILKSLGLRERFDELEIHHADDMGGIVEFIKENAREQIQADFPQIREYIKPTKRMIDGIKKDYAYWYETQLRMLLREEANRLALQELDRMTKELFPEKLDTDDRKR